MGKKTVMLKYIEIKGQIIITMNMSLIILILVRPRHYMKLLQKIIKQLAIHPETAGSRFKIRKWHQG